MSDVEQFDREPERKAPSRLNKKARKRSGRGLLIGGALLLLLIGGALGVAFLLEVGPFAPPAPITFSYRDRVLEAKEGVPVNRCDPAGFTVDGEGRISYTQNGLWAREGIDVSFYQGEIDWAAVAADGVDFAVIRLGYRGYTEGGLQMDSRFVKNLHGALSAGLDAGVYFFSQAISPEEAEEEADFVLQQLDDCLPEGENLTYPVVFDWEPITPGKGARTDGMDGETLTQCAAAFCQRIARGGYTPAVYFNQDQGYLTYDLAQLSQYTFWLADYDLAPDFYYAFDLWQYTHNGTVAGIQGSVDRNLDLRPVHGAPEES